MWYHTVCESKNPNEHGLITAACSKQFHIYMYMYIYIYITNNVSLIKKYFK